MSVEPAREHAWSGARALVFGATGFIGSWVARALATRGAQLSLAVRAHEAGARLCAQLGPGARVMDCDVTSDERVEQLVQAVRPHITFNLAGYGVDRTERDERLARRVNGEFVAVLCAAVASYREVSWAGQALVHAGTQLEYGPLGGHLHEDCAPLPETLYGRTKLEGTLALSQCALARGLPALTARLFTVYGPGEHAGRLLPTLIGAATTTEPLPMTAGTQRTDFTYVEDVAEGLLRLGLATATPGMVVNLATGRLTSIRAFAELAATQLGLAPQRLQFGALTQRPETLRYESVSIVRLRELTGWVPPTDVAGGIRRTMEKREHMHG